MFIDEKPVSMSFKVHQMYIYIYVYIYIYIYIFNNPWQFCVFPLISKKSENLKIAPNKSRNPEIFGKVL